MPLGSLIRGMQRLSCSLWITSDLSANPNFVINIIVFSPFDFGTLIQTDGLGMAVQLFSIL